MPDDKSKYAWEGKVIRLTHGDFEQWKKAFSFLDLNAALLARDIELSEEGKEDERKRWFFSTAMWLAAWNQSQKRLSDESERRNKKRFADPYRGDALASQYEKEED